MFTIVVQFGDWEFSKTVRRHTVTYTDATKAKW